MNRALSVRVIAGGVALALGALFLAEPALLAQRFKAPANAVQFEQAASSITLGLAVGLVSIAGAYLAGLRISSASARRWLTYGAVSVTYLALVSALSDWMIDDAAITFAYSENLARGHGITLHPSLPPEEGYSNTLWMLWLAGWRSVGLAIPPVAKWSCVALGLVTIFVVQWAVARLNTDPPSTQADDSRLGDGMMAFLPSFVLLAAPFLVWSVSGLEHTLQGLCILIAAIAPLITSRWQIATALAHCGLVLVRPEAPLVVAACFAVHVLQSRRGVRLFEAIRRNLFIAVVPAAVWATLIGFRLWYFGDPLPNPFYAKASDATFLRLANFVGGGWEYVFSWVFGSGILVTIPFVLRAWSRSSAPLPIRLGLGMLGAHFAFVIYAAGDWMGCWRFVAPGIPTLAVIVGWAYHQQVAADRAEPHAQRAGWATAAVVGITIFALTIGGTKQYMAFVSAPTTPFKFVAAVGERFVELGQRFGMTDPVLAHHDAGGTSYQARIRLLDLGGLGSRTIAKNWGDAEFTSRYILDEVSPDFVFGVAHNFAAGASLFWQRPEFRERYVRVEFPGDAHMVADLCYMKRSIVEHAATLPSGIQVERTGGTITKVIVN